MRLVPIPPSHGNKSMLGPRPNTCFARDGKGLSSGTLVTWAQTLTLTRDWWLVIAD